MTTIALAEDHEMVREGLKRILRDDTTLKLVGEAEDGLKAVQLVETLKPNILLLDLMIPRLHGLEVIRQVREFNNTTKIIVVSMHSDEPYVVEAFRNGASGYVLKDSTSVTLLQAIRTVVTNHHYVDPKVVAMSIDLFAKKFHGPAPDALGTLTARERMVLHLAAEGNDTPHIAKKLFISPRTVESHRARMMQKLSLRTQTDLVRFAIRKKIINP